MQTILCLRPSAIVMRISDASRGLRDAARIISLVQAIFSAGLLLFIPSWLWWIISGHFFLTPCSKFNLIKGNMGLSFCFFLIYCNRILREKCSLMPTLNLPVAPPPWPPGGFRHTDLLRAFALRGPSSSGRLLWRTIESCCLLPSGTFCFPSLFWIAFITSSHATSFTSYFAYFSFPPLQ